MRDLIDQFTAAIRAGGLEPPEAILADGKIHRFSSNGKRGDDSGWYVLHLDRIPAGSFGCWRTGFKQYWHADTKRVLTAQEKADHRAKIVAMKQQRKSEEARRHAESATKAAEIWAAAKSTPADHPYLVRKNIKPYGIREHNGALVAPMHTDGKIHSLQFIEADGNKRFLTGGRVKGCYFSIGNPILTTGLCIVEGFATGVTLHEATGYPVAIAFNAGNLMAVAKAMHQKFPELQIIVCADDDWRTDGNPGLTRAREAAQAVDGILAVPDFGDDRQDESTDFNDMARLWGVGSVSTLIQSYVALNTLRCGNENPSATLEAAPAVDCSVVADKTAEREKNNSNINDDEIIQRLIGLSPLEYDRVRKDKAELLGVRPATLDKMVNKAQKDEAISAIDCENVEPWEYPIDPPQLLTDVSAVVKRFIVCQQETADAVALWAAMTWFMDVVQIAPLAVITAPEKRCGKSQLLFLLGKLSCRPLTASNISSAALFRAIDAWKPTLLIDEADAFMRENEELRGLLNCGHTRDSAYIVRVVGDDFTPTKFTVWGAKAIAGIGHLADTLMDRAIALELRRKLPHESVERLRYAEPGLFDSLAAKLARFAEDYQDAVRRARPDLPESLNDRAQDNWEPLLAIADVAGGDWPELARKAALKLSGSDSPTQSVGTELLSDIQEVFETKRIDKISTADLILALCDDDEKPWATYNRGKSISPRQIAKRLGEYGIKSDDVRFGYGVKKGYKLEWFQEAFSRYLSSPPKLSATTLQSTAGADSSVAAKKVLAQHAEYPLQNNPNVADKVQELNTAENLNADDVEVF
jgi:putative DNA primase/helicase